MLAAANPALAAAAGGGGPRCDEPAFAAGGAALRLGRASGIGRIDLLGDGEGCPGPGAACRSGAFLAPGRRLLLGPSRPGYVCVFSAGRIAGNSGWVAQRRIAAATRPIDPMPPLASWTGQWRNGDNRIALAQAGESLSGTGEAWWPGKSIMPANEGAFAGTAKPAGNRLRLVADDPTGCAVGMILAGPFLVIADNRMCGGHNVSFAGIFVRAGPPARGR